MLTSAIIIVILLFEVMSSCARLSICADRLIPPNNRHNVNWVIASVSKEERDYMRKGRKDWEAKHMTKAIRKKPDLVNDVWFGDHHQFDVFVLDRRGRAVRPWLTAWYDIGSGVLVGWCISTNPNSETIAESFIRAVAEKPDSPIHGAPNAIYIDNGKDYRSHAFDGEPRSIAWPGHIS